MRITVEDETRVVVTSSPELDVREPADAHFGPLQMLAASLGGCILAVLHSWGDAVGEDPGGISVAVEWSYVDDPYRVDRFRTRIRWPGLGEDRHARARRVAGTCTVHHTLERPPEMELEIEG